MALMTTAFTPASGALGAGGLTEFFRHHGVWAPGVRLFRSLLFRTKAMTISAAFVLPLVGLTWVLWAQTADNVASARAESQGVVYLKPLLELIDVAQQRRHAATLKTNELAGLQQRADAAWEQLEARQQSAGAALATGEAFEALKKQHASLRQNPVAASPDDTFAAHGEYIAAAMDLMGAVAGGSGLVLDPEADSYHMMNMVAVFGPRQTENTTALATLGTLVLQSADFGASRRDRVVQAAATQRFIDGFVEGSYLAAVASAPELERQVDMKGTDEAFDAFQGVIKTQLMGPALKGTAAEYFAAGSKIVAKQNQLNGQVAARLEARLHQRVTRLYTTLAVQAGVAMLFVMIGAYLFYSFFLVTHGGLREVQKHLEAITAGDLTTQPSPWGKDEAAILISSLADMQGSLRNIVAAVRGSSESIVHASSEIASASMDLSSRTEQTASNLEESASSMEEISSTVRQTADNVRQAATVASTNSQAAARGGAVITEVVSTMNDINTSSKKIGDIIGTIDGIAFQTNILALNAAVEAARAGEQGRGFAVVAAEVRSLAQRSAEAAKQIKMLITTSVDKVEAGTNVVRGAGDTMEELVANASRINQLLADISTAAAEQSDGVGHVGAAVSDLDQMTQQNAALVEQTAAAASALKDQALNLATQVDKFRLPAVAG
jgi:methyl-accepting chemotaxis protein